MKAGDELGFGFGQVEWDAIGFGDGGDKEAQEAEDLRERSGKDIPAEDAAQSEKAVAVGLTGIGGGSFTVPALVLLAGLTAGEAVGTAFLFAGVLRLIAAPFYLLGKQIHSRYLWLLLQGAIPGLLLGTLALRILNRDAGSPFVILLLGVLLAASSSVTLG